MMYQQIIRFLIIGVLNTTLDAGIFYLLRSADVPLLLAVIVSTSCGLVFSYLMNRRFTFGGVSSKHSAWQFVAITLAGLWVLQPLVIYSLAALTGNDSAEWQTVFKLLATGITMVWNFTWYHRRVFRPATGSAS